MSGGYKMRHGLPCDARLAVAAKRAHTGRGVALATWVALLDMASRNHPRGRLDAPDAEELAATLDIDAGTISALIDAFRAKGMITPTGMIAGFAASHLSPSAARTRAWRARRKAKARRFPTGDDTDEAVASRRARLQQQMLDRHQKRGRTVAPPAPETFP